MMYQPAEPVITVLMSCYNASRWLEQSIGSVLNQTFMNFEFVVVDDGSTDNTLNIIRGFAEKDPRIVIITKPNSGLADSLNMGIQKARGEWIARLDADDICEPDRLQKQLDLARLDSGLVFIGTGLTIIDESSVRHMDYSYPGDHAGLLRHLQTVRKFPPHSSAFYKTRIVRGLGGYRTRIKRAQDWDLWLRLSGMGKMACLNEPLVRIRKHTGQISHDESGGRQLTDSRTAMVSYWLRRYGVPDPVEADEATYQTFRSWVVARLERDEFFEFQAHAALLRSLINDVRKSSLNIIRLLIVCVKHPFFTLRFIKEILWGERLAHRLAVKWAHSKN